MKQKPEIRDRIKELRRVCATELVPASVNWRTHSAKQRTALASVLEEIGIADAVLARELPDGRLQLIDGHLRRETLGESLLPVLVLDVSEREAAILLATIDPLAAMAGTDVEKLDAVLREATATTPGVQEFLAEIADDAGLYCDDEKEIVEDEVPEPPPEPITRPGDLWILGDHRLLCGDSTKAENVGRLMGGAKASTMITDPPFGISYKSNMEGDLPRSIVGDTDTKARDCALAMFNDKFPIACFATWHCTPPRKPRGMLIWKKNVGGMGDLTFPWSLDYEVVWIFGVGWSGHRGSSVLEGETICTWNTGPAARVHPHQKPVRVISQLIEKSDGTVFDPFLGSGTTLIAAEQLGRRCYGLEISPAYCDVIVARWEKLTGRKATLERSQHPPEHAK
jgi:ParB-like chromosome segregation protein Spo0J